MHIICFILFILLYLYMISSLISRKKSSEDNHTLGYFEDNFSFCKICTTENDKKCHAKTFFHDDGTKIIRLISRSLSRKSTGRTWKRQKIKETRHFICWADYHTVQVLWRSGWSLFRHSTHINHDFLLLRWGYSSVAHYVNLIKSINETTWNSHFQLFILYTIIWLYNGMGMSITYRHHTNSSQQRWWWW